MIADAREAVLASLPSRPAQRLTPSVVEERLVDAFRDLPGHPVFSRRYGQLRDLDGGPAEELTGLALIAFAERVLPREPTRPTYQQALFTWARCRAGHGAGSIYDVCREAGWSRATYDRRRRRAAGVVAEAA